MDNYNRLENSMYENQLCAMYFRGTQNMANKRTATGFKQVDAVFGITREMFITDLFEAFCT